jgi:hypothetical protein
MSLDLEKTTADKLSQILGLGSATKTTREDVADFTARFDQFLTDVTALNQKQAQDTAAAQKAEPVNTVYSVNGKVIGYQSEDGMVFTDKSVASAVKSIGEEAEAQGLSGVAASTYQADRLKEELSKYYGGAEVDATVYKDGAAPSVGEVMDAMFNGSPLPDGDPSDPATVAQRLGLSTVRFDAETLGLLNAANEA